MLRTPTSALAIVLIAGSAAALALRHDVDEAKFVALGESFPAVVQIGGLASGTLIAPDWVLTVAHAPEMIQRMRPDDPLEVTIGDATYEVKRVVIPEARAKEPERHDIALLELKQPVPKEVAPLKLHVEALEPEAEFVLAGWGVLAIGDKGVELSAETMRAPTRALRAGWNVVERVDEKTKQLVADFDAPGTAHALEAAPCIGDSGGPALVRVEGEGEAPATWQVAGVIASIDDTDEDRILGEYGEEFAMTPVATYADWIRATLAE